MRLLMERLCTLKHTHTQSHTHTHTHTQMHTHTQTHTEDFRGGQYTADNSSGVQPGCRPTRLMQRRLRGSYGAPTNYRQRRADQQKSAAAPTNLTAAARPAHDFSWPN